MVFLVRYLKASLVFGLIAAVLVSALLASAPDEAAEAALDRAARLVRSQRRAGAV